MPRNSLKNLSVVALLVCSSLWGCHADLDDPKGQADELADAVRRQHAIGRLQSIWSTRLSEAKNDRSAAPIKEFLDATHSQLTATYVDHPEDTQAGEKILRLMQEMRDPRTLPALMKALEWKAEVSENHAVTAAITMTELDIADDKKATAVKGICAALERVDGARGVDNRMRKAFLEVLGKMRHKGATQTLLKVALTQDEAQNFLFNKLAAQQLAFVADPSAVDGMIRALYLFDPKNPQMRMMEEATSVLVAIGKPSLDPLLATLRGENEEANKLVDLSIQTFKRKDPNVAAAMNRESLVAREAVITLGRLGYRESLDALLKEAASEDKDRRSVSALSLVFINREDTDTAKIVAAMKDVYEKSEKQARPQLLVAFRHLYTDDVMGFLHGVAKTTETELPPVQMYGFVSYALLANKAESANLPAILETEELIKPHIQDYTVAIEAANECDEDIDCWVGKLKDPGIKTDSEENRKKNYVVLRKAANMLARFGRGNDKAAAGLIELFGHEDLEVRNEALSALDFVATKGSQAAVDKIDELERIEGGRSIWNNFKREAMPTRSRLLLRGGS